MPPTSDRRQLNAYLSDEAHDGWRNTSREHRVSVSAMLEALGLTLDEIHAAPPPWLRAIVRRAAEIDEARRSRRVE